MNVVIMGVGSIGSRHARILRELGCNISVVTSRELDEWQCHKNLDTALAMSNPDYVVLANRTSDHYSALERLAQLGYAGLVLVEKPLFHAPLALPLNRFTGLFVAYNLRFHPVLQKLRSVIRDETVVCANIYAGQYLPQWRPNSDYRSGYSASKAAGGGVLRDLSHELDYALWILGKWRAVTALGGHLSGLQIDSDDVYSLILVTERCPVVSIQVNYLDRVARREFVVITEEHTFRADLVRGTLQVDDKSEDLLVDRDYTYRCQHQAVMAKQLDTLCSVSEGLEVLALIDGTERASARREWISR